MQKAAYRRCWITDGVRHCRWFADPYDDYGYYYYDDDDYYYDGPAYGYGPGVGFFFGGGRHGHGFRGHGFRGGHFHHGGGRGGGHFHGGGHGGGHRR